MINPQTYSIAHATRNQGPPGDHQGAPNFHRRGNPLATGPPTHSHPPESCRKLFITPHDISFRSLRSFLWIYSSFSFSSWAKSNYAPYFLN